MKRLWIVGAVVLALVYGGLAVGAFAALVSLGVGLVLVAFLWFGGAAHEQEHHRRGYGPGQQPAPSSSSAMP